MDSLELKSLISSLGVDIVSSSQFDEACKLSKSIKQQDNDVRLQVRRITWELCVVATTFN